MRVDTYLTTLDHVRASLGMEADETADDALLLDLIGEASDIVDQMTGRAFVPHVATRAYDARGPHLDGQTLRLDDDLLAITTLTNGDGTTLASSGYVLRGAGTPKWAIELLDTAAWTYSSAWQNAISVAGTWGYHEDWANAWVSTNDTVQDAGGIDATTSALTVTDADGRDGRYRTRFAVGQLLRIDDEYLHVAAVNATSNALTVLRGWRGTTAASHDNGAAIASYAPMRNVEKACAAMVVFMYRNRETEGDKLQLFDGGQMLLSNKTPRVIEDVLSSYRRCL